ncbi:metal ABC transporter permease [Ohtaekwangia koreensis]|uniref:Manganese/zinc/iron transport system permease protein n=1 Tax=Ohtaekwangia koreensis TaxID=688867 RepID=A0A1T5M4W0_9BACT|nr:metal ABC transporter permease [Ohtaekwangia koreensis]SKC83183.1 manganese/zinc/iron transport system permease protein [Ohtaekwangia koreensis]
MNNNDLSIIFTASLVASSCALLGCFLILRKMAMVGDAISHAVLPGIVIAFLISGSRDSMTMLIGAGLIGVLTTFLIEFLHKKAKLQTDASIGVTFTWLFAIGVVLISLFAGKVDLDQDCVLYGEIAYVPLDTLIVGGQSIGPRALYIMGIILTIIILFIWIGYKELFLTTFDPAYASAIGISTTLWHYLLMGAVSATTVASFESVGAILVVALLIAPAATAYLITDNLKWMLVIACIAGIVASITGYFFAVWLDGSIAGAIAAMAGAIFVLAMIFSPTHGILMKKISAQPES